MKSVILAAVLAAGITAQAQTSQPEEKAIVHTQYGASALHQSTVEKEVVATVIEVSGMSAWALYQGMTDVKEVVTPVAFGSERQKVGQNITCTINALQQSSCLIQVSKLAVGQL